MIVSYSKNRFFLGKPKPDKVSWQKRKTKRQGRHKSELRICWTGVENQRKGQAASTFAREEVQFQASLLNQVFPIRNTSKLLTSRTRGPQWALKYYCWLKMSLFWTYCAFDAVPLSAALSLEWHVRQTHKN